MKTSKTIITLLFLFSACSLMAQNDDNKAKFREGFEKIIKQKLVDSLGFDENTASKFLNLYQENNKTIRGLSKQKRDIMETMELNTDAPDVGTNFDKILDIDTKILDERKNFFQDLKTFLTPQQIAKTLVLRNRLKKQLKKEFKQKMDDKKKNNLDGSN